MQLLKTTLSCRYKVWCRVVLVVHNGKQFVQCPLHHHQLRSFLTVANAEPAFTINLFNQVKSLPDAAQKNSIIEGAVHKKQIEENQHHTCLPACHSLCEGCSSLRRLARATNLCLQRRSTWRWQKVKKAVQMKTEVGNPWLQSASFPIGSLKPLQECKQMGKSGEYIYIFCFIIIYVRGQPFWRFPKL